MLIQFDHVIKFSLNLIMLYFIVFYIYKVGVGFTSPSEPMRHPFGNDAPHIKL
jgi:hypothetical protein